jgi:pilus assembly protein FimV
VFSQPQRTTAQPAPQRTFSRWALTATVWGIMALAPLTAWSLTLGGMRVQSALGEPLRAQLSLGELTPEELNSVNAGFAPAAVFRAAGIVLNPVLSNVQISIDRSVPTNVMVNLTSTSPMSEPFLDILLEIKWASGKVVRDYTLLFNAANTTSVPTGTEQVVTAEPSVTDPALPVPNEPATRAVGTVVDASSATPASPTPAAEPPAAKTTPEPTSAAAEPAPPATAQASATPTAPQRLRVVRGDTAAGLVKAQLPPGVSLDQMLQALLRANPDAFVDNNVNRLKTGAQLTVPTAEEAQSIDPAQARRLVVAQSKDFNAYRRSLASNAPASAVSPAGQEAAGRIETQVQDKAEAAPTPDQLTLSKGSVATGAEAEAQIAAAKKAQDEQAQQAHLNRNIDDLKALAQAAPGTGSPGASATDSTKGPTVVTPAPEAPTAPATPEPEVAKPRNAVEALMAQPWTLPAAFGLLAVLMGLVISRMNQRKASAATSDTAPTLHNTAANDDQVEATPTTGLNFNLSDINLDLNPSAESANASDAANSEALFTKFELAKEFLSLGDRVAAKALAEEVHADATGLLKRRAELFLSELG